MVAMPRKTNIEILKAIQKFVNESKEKTFYKSALRKEKVEPSTAAEWFRIIEFCQTKLPKIKIIEMKKNMVIEILNNEEES
jgi:hypothetical protein